MVHVPVAAGPGAGESSQTRDTQMSPASPKARGITVWIIMPMLCVVLSLGAAACSHAVGEPEAGDHTGDNGTILEAWNSALGEPCRRIQREVSYIGPVTVLECRDGARWRRMRDLANFGTTLTPHSGVESSVSNGAP